MPEDLLVEGMAEGVDTIALHIFIKELSYYQPNQPPHMPRVILNRLKAKAEELLAEEQASFIPGRRYHHGEMLRLRHSVTVEC